MDRALDCASFAGTSATTAANAETGFVRINHFAAMLLFALLISVALAALGQRTGAERCRYAVWSFALFVLVGVGIAWLMYPFSH
jgi:hypothetical protein